MYLFLDVNIDVLVFTFKDSETVFQGRIYSLFQLQT